MSAEHSLYKSLLALTEAHPKDVVVTLLRCAPSCDRSAQTMWRTIISSKTTVQPVLQILFVVLPYWPVYSMCTSDGDDTDVSTVAATMALWQILHLPRCPRAVMKNSHRILLALLLQVFMTTQQMPEEVNTLWKQCQQQHYFTTNFNSFVVRTIKALLCHLGYEDVLMSMERKCGWDTLLNADTHHYAVGVLARELHRVARRLCCNIALGLLRLLRRKEFCWELPALAFLVEVLTCLKRRQCGDRVLQILSRHLWSHCRERRYLALKGFEVLSKIPSMADDILTLTGRLIELLKDADSDTVGMTLSVFTNLLQFKAIQISSPIPLKLAEVLRPLFDNDHSHVQQLSMALFTLVMELIERAGKNTMKPHVHLSLLPLYFHWHDENQLVAQASRRTLFHAVRFLKRRQLQHLVHMDQSWGFSERLLEKDKGRAAEYLRRALPYLESPQEPLRELAVRFMGIAARYMTGQEEELQLVCRALQGMNHDSPAIKNLAFQTLHIIRAVQKSPFSRLQ